MLHGRKATKSGDITNATGREFMLLAISNSCFAPKPDY